MTRVAVYPYTDEYKSLFAVLSENKEICMSCGISPSGFGYKNKTVECDGIVYSIYVGHEDIDWNEIDDLLIVDSIELIKEESVERFLSKVPRSVKVCYYSSKNSVCYHKIKDICDAAGLCFVTYEDDRTAGALIGKRRKKIEVPVIMIFGVSVCTNKFDVQLYLRKQLSEKGYIVENIGTRIVAEYIGLHKIPDCFFGSGCSEIDKILMFNDYIYSLISKDADVLIIGVPGGIMPVSPKHCFDYGIYAYEIACACSPDYVVCSLINGEYTKEFAQEIQQLFKYRFNCQVDAFIISDYRVVSNSINDDVLEFAFCEGHPDQKPDHFYDMQDVKNGVLTDHILEKLCLYGQFKMY